MSKKLIVGVSIFIKYPPKGDKMNKFEILYSSIRENKLSAYNQITTKNLGVCFNIIEVPSKEGINVNTAILTVSVMKNRKRTKTHGD